MEYGYVRHEYFGTYFMRDSLTCPLQPTPLILIEFVKWNRSKSKLDLESRSPSAVLARIVFCGLLQQKRLYQLVLFAKSRLKASLCLVY